MKVVHVIWHLGQGGAQTYLYQLIKELTQIHGAHQQELLVLSSYGPLSDKFQDIGLTISYAEMKNGLDLAGAYRSYRILSNSKADIIHSHSNNLLFNVMLHMLGKPVLYTEHGGGLLGKRKRDRYIYKYMYRPITIFVAISNEMARLMKAINPVIAGRIVTIHNGVNLDAIAGEQIVDELEWKKEINSKRYYVGIIGRLVEQKGVDLFVDVADKLSTQRDDIGFVIVGDGPLRSLLQQKVNDLGLTDTVFFTGYKSNGIAWLKRFDVFLFTSKYEPFGLVITEAMASGVPVVAAHRRGAVLEIIDDGESGLVVEGENPELLAECVSRVLDDKTLREHLIFEAKRTVNEKFLINANADAVATAYNDCVVVNSNN